MVARKLLFILLSIALLIEAGLSFGAFFMRGSVLSLFKLTETPDTSFLTYVVGWLCVFVTMIICLAMWMLWKNREGHRVLCYLLGVFWICIGTGIYIAFKRPDNLWIDSIKGLLIIIAAYFSSQSRKPAG